MFPSRLVPLTFCLLALVLTPKLFGQTPFTQPDEINRLVDALADPSPPVRRAAETSLYMLPPEDFHALEAASNRPDLAPEAQVRLKSIIGHERPRQAARERRAAVIRADWQTNLQSALDAYNKVGRRNPKWDEDARKGIRRFVSYGSRVVRASARESFEKAIAAGCDDPLVLYMEARQLQDSPNANSEELDKLYRMAADGMEKSNYPADRKQFALLRYFFFKANYEMNRAGVAGGRANEQVSQTLGRLLWTGGQLWPQTVQLKGEPQIFLLEISGMILDDAGHFGADTRKKAFDDLIVPLEKAQPNRPTPLILKGQFYTTWAWDARGNGFGNTVTPEGARLMQERLKIAEEALTKAWKLDPNDPAAATQMIAVKLGQGGARQDMEQWFERAMAADPDNNDACAKKLYYLEPKWYGSPEEMLAFGRQCRDGKNWRTDIPFQLVNAHETLAGYTRSADEYYRTPLVWQDVSSVYEPYLEARPRDFSTRSRFALWACRCGQWATARRQFQLLGDNAVAFRFGGAEKMARYRQLADSGGQPTPLPE